MARVAVILTAALAITGSVEVTNAVGKPRHKGCNTHKCDKRVVKKHMKRTIKPHRGILNAIAWCESRMQDIRERGGSDHTGYLQMSSTLWQWVGGFGIPMGHSKLEQFYRGAKVINELGTQPWAASQSCWG